MKIKGIIFDLDGVIVSTDEFHYQAWRKLSDEEGIPFERETNELLRGVSRMESLEIILKNTEKIYTDSEKEILASKKNNYYVELLNNLSPQNILPGVKTFISQLKENGLKIAIGSSSKNTPTILKKINMTEAFDAIADGNEILNSKPDPEVFLLAAKKLNLNPEKCIVVEDAEAGVDAALAANMKVIGVGSASKYKLANYKLETLENINLTEIID